MYETRDFTAFPNEVSYDILSLSKGRMPRLLIPHNNPTTSGTFHSLKILVQIVSRLPPDLDISNPLLLYVLYMKFKDSFYTVHPLNMDGLVRLKHVTVITTYNQQGETN
jgi:hypothetical protein